MDGGEGDKVDPFRQRIRCMGCLRRAARLIAIGCMDNKDGTIILGTLAGHAVAGVTSQIVSPIGNAKELKRIGAVIGPVILIQQISDVAGIGQ